MLPAVGRLPDGFQQSKTLNDPSYIRRFVSFVVGEVPQLDGLGTLSCSLSCFTAGHFGRSSTDLN